MDEAFFDAPLFMKALDSAPVNISTTPYFCNETGSPTFLQALPPHVALLEPAPYTPKIAFGRTYDVSVGAIEDRITQLKFDATEVVYEPMWATKETAASFGITLVEKMEAVRITSPNPELTQTTYRYGAFAGHQSPYQGQKKQLVPVVCTDLERHDFPHVFASVDPHLPLVISVGCYWPNQGKICLADLWVPIGTALYLPSSPGHPDCIYLHGNRNSARACWGRVGQNSVRTQTLLLNDLSSCHWFWNELPTVHRTLLHN